MMFLGLIPSVLQHVRCCNTHTEKTGTWIRLRCHVVFHSRWTTMTSTGFLGKICQKCRNLWVVDFLRENSWKRPELTMRLWIKKCHNNFRQVFNFVNLAHGTSGTRDTNMYKQCTNSKKLRMPNATVAPFLNPEAYSALSQNRSCHRTTHCTYFFQPELEKVDINLHGLHPSCPSCLVPYPALASCLVLSPAEMQSRSERLWLRVPNDAKLWAQIFSSNRIMKFRSQEPAAFYELNTVSFNSWIELQLFLHCWSLWTWLLSENTK